MTKMFSGPPIPGRVGPPCDIKQCDKKRPLALAWKTGRQLKIRILLKCRKAQSVDARSRGRVELVDVLELVDASQPDIPG